MRWTRWALKWRWPILAGWLCLILFLGGHLIHFLVHAPSPIDPDVALKTRMVEAITYARSISSMSADMMTQHVYILPRKLERTPTHKIKYVFELERLDEARKI